MRTKLLTSVRVLAALVLGCGVFLLARQMVLLSNAAAGVAASVAQTPIGPLGSSRIPSEKQQALVRGAQEQIDILSSNLANARTIGFKRTFAEQVPGPDQGECVVDMNQGPLTATNMTLDVAIVGEGFFHVKISPNISDGTAYTRAGSFMINKSGNLILGVGPGYELIPPLSLPSGATNISIDPDGTVKYTPRDGNQPTVAGVIKLCRFRAPTRMFTGNGLYMESALSGPPVVCSPGEDNTGTLQQGFLEQSNVDPMHEWAEMAKAQQLLVLDQKASQLLQQTRQTVASLERE
jgi:flagellar basal body rod protein FlgG